MNRLRLPLLRRKSRDRVGGAAGCAARTLRPTSALLILTLLSGCGYTTKEIFPKQYRTVAVPAFENQTFYRGIEFDLSEALTKEIESRTPYRVAPPSRADTRLTGTITKIDQDRLFRTEQASLPQQQEVLVTVNFRWQDLNRGEVIRNRAGFEAAGRFVPAAPVSQPFEVASRQAVQTLAREIVSTMQADWGRRPSGSNSNQTRQSEEGDTKARPAEPQDGSTTAPATRPRSGDDAE